MKMFTKVLSVVLILLITISLIIGCGANEDSGFQSNTSAENSLMSNREESHDIDEGSGSTDDGKISDTLDLEPEKLITTTSLQIETTEFKETNKKLTNIIDKYNGYVENSNISYNQDYNKKRFQYGSFSIRIPKEDLNNFKLDLNNIGNIIWESTNKEDITKQYKDTESHLKVITVKEERILSLLEKAEKIEDIIALEDQLSEIIREKENLKESLLNMDNLVDFGTIHLEIQEVENLTDPETLDTGFKIRIKNAMKNSVFRFKKAMEDIFIGTIYFLPYLLIFIFLFFMGYKLYKFLFNRKNKS